MLQVSSPTGDASVPSGPDRPLSFPLQKRGGRPAGAKKRPSPAAGPVPEAASEHRDNGRPRESCLNKLFLAVCRVGKRGGLRGGRRPGSWQPAAGAR